MVEIRNITSGYPGKPVLEDLSLTIPRGKVTVLLGPNGCGKSTLLKTICGILTARNGQVLMEGEDILTLPRQELARKTAYLAQSRQVPDITVGRLVLHGRFPHLGYPRRYRKRDYILADEAMKTMGILELKELPVSALSGGQRQKVYIAMALAQDTPVILLDEPTTYLDISHQLKLMEQARELTRRGKTVVMILHDLPHAFRTADHIVLMKDGAVAAEGNPEAIYRSGEVGRVFGVDLRRVETEAGWRYYCEEERV